MTITLAELESASAAGHDCTTACVAMANSECGCSAAPTMCEDCAEFFFLHPGAL